LQNGGSSIILADNGDIGLNSQNINLNAVSVDIVSSDLKITSIRANKS
jgi:hypothetical protein